MIQELALAKQAHVQCGTRSIHWEDFADAVSMFVLRFEQIKKLLRNRKLRPEDPDHLREAKRLGPSLLVEATNNLFRRRNDNLIVERQKTLETLISTLTAYEAADPRDTIYAVLSIAKDTWRGNHPLAAHASQSSIASAISGPPSDTTTGQATNGAATNGAATNGDNESDALGRSPQPSDLSPQPFMASKYKGASLAEQSRT